MAQVTGRGLIVLIRRLKATLGESGWDRLQDALSEPTRTAIGRRLKGMDYYPYALYAELMQRAEPRLTESPDRFWREFGFAVASESYAGEYEVMKGLTAAQLVMGCGFVWAMQFKDMGRVTVPMIREAERRAEVIIENPGPMIHAHCHLFSGWLDSGFPLCGEPQGRSTLLACHHDADAVSPGPRYGMAW